MNQPTNTTLRITIIAASILFLLSGILAIGSFGNALAGIDPAYRNQQLVYPVSEDTANVLWMITVAAVPLTIAVAIFAVLNFKYKSQRLSMVLLSACGVIALWLVFAGWGLNGKYVPGNDYYNPSSGSDEKSLQIRSINLN